MGVSCVEAVVQCAGNRAPRRTPPTTFPRIPSKSGNNQQQIVIFFFNICEPMREYRDIQAKHKNSFVENILPLCVNSIFTVKVCLE